MPWPSALACQQARRSPPASRPPRRHPRRCRQPPARATCFPAMTVRRSAQSDANTSSAQGRISSGRTCRYETTDSPLRSERGVGVLDAGLRGGGAALGRATAAAGGGAALRAGGAAAGALRCSTGADGGQRLQATRARRKRRETHRAGGGLARAPLEAAGGAARAVAAPPPFTRGVLLLSVCS